MKIAVLSQKLTGGGAERVASLWIEGFEKQGHEVFLIIDSSRPDAVTYPLSKKVRLYNLFEPSAFRKWTNKILKKLGLTPLVPSKLRSIFTKEKPDVIICVLPPFAYWALKASKGLNIPIINTEHNSFERPDYAPMSRRTWIDKYRLNKLFSYVTVLTQRDYELISTEMDNVSVLPNPLAFLPVEQIPKKEKIILLSGRLNVWHCKGLDLAIKAWGKIAAKYPDWTLKIAGTNDDKSQELLIKIARKENLDLQQIEFLGFRDDVLSLYKQAELFVLSSRYEGFGMSLIEAMSQGCACITCDYLGRQREIIQNENQGIICPIDDANSLSIAMEKMIEDENFRKKCQVNAIERSKYFSLPNIMDMWNCIFKKLNLVK